MHKIFTYGFLEMIMCEMPHYLLTN